MTTKYRDPQTGKVVLDEIAEPIFDTIDIANGESPIGVREYFNITQGKSEILTNLQQAKQLQKSVSFRVLGIGYDVQNVWSENWNCIPLIMEKSSLAFQVAEKIYWNSALTFIEGRVDANYAIDSTVAGTQRRSLVHAGKCANYISMVGRNAINLEELTAFSVKVTTSGMNAAEIALATPSAGAGTKLRTMVSLQGLKRRPVQ